MPVPGDTPFLYRFRTTKAEDGSLRVYGPRPLVQVVQYYASKDECEARPADGADTDWRPASEWTIEYAPSPATERQVKRLAKLGVAHRQDVSQEEALQIIQEAEELLPPTKGLREKAEAAGVTVSDSETRGSLRDKIGEAERLEEVARLRKLGAEVPADASWEELSSREERLEIEAELRRKGISFAPGTSVDDLEDARYVLEDLKEAASHARQAGLRYQIEKGIGIGEARAHAQALTAIGDLYESLHLYCDGRGGSPKRAELKEALGVLFERLKSGSVAEEEATRWVEHRIGLKPAGGGGGCLSLVAVLLPLALGVVVLAGVLG